MRIMTLAVALAACSGGRTQISIGPPPARTTRAALAGALCHGDSCTCRELTAVDDGGVGVPDGALKRFEVRLQSAQELWASLRGEVLYKNPEKVETCFYVDLPAGETPLELRASNKDGVSAQWTIRELGTKTKSWYDTFTFECGNPGVCSFEELDAARDRMNALKKRGVHDPCGSTRIKNLTWDTGKSPDMLHPSELVVRLSLDVRKVQPWKVHGDETCGKGRPPAEAGSDAPVDDAPAAP
jgi:hypothetical protein